MTSFLYLVSYRAHCGAIVAVFIGGPKHAQDRGRRKTVMHRKYLVILSLASISTIPRAPLCRHSPTLLFDTPVNSSGSFFKE